MVTNGLDYEAMADELMRCQESLEEYLSRKDIGEEAAIVENALLDVGIASCRECGYWWDYFELDDSGLCSDCYERERDGQAD